MGDMKVVYLGMLCVVPHPWGEGASLSTVQGGWLDQVKHGRWRTVPELGVWPKGEFLLWAQTGLHS